MAGSLCQTGDSCKENGSYCFAGGSQACRYLECVGNSWHCPTDAGVALDAAAAARDAAADAGIDAPQDVQSQ